MQFRRLTVTDISFMRVEINTPIGITFDIRLGADWVLEEPFVPQGAGLLWNKQTGSTTSQSNARSDLPWRQLNSMWQLSIGIFKGMFINEL